MHVLRAAIAAAILACCAATSLVAGPPPLPAPELQLVVPPGLLSGTVIETSARLVAGDSNVRSWSLAVTNEGFRFLSASSAGTDFDRLSQGGYAESGVSPEGEAFYSIGVLSFTDPVTLPAGSSEVLRASCLITRKSPGEVRLLPRDGLKIPEDDREHINAVIVRGGESIPLRTSDKLLSIKGCAGLAMKLAPAAPPAPGAEATRTEVRTGTLLDVRVLVKVASPDHLQPTGFAFGAQQDAAVLALESAELLASFTDSFVRPDGFARFESSPAGFAAAVLSSAANPITLGTGDHEVAKITYRFVGTGHAGDPIDTSVSLSDELTIGGNPVTASFQPRDALPCELSSLPIGLKIGPDWWIRGDGSSDGKADLTDAIATLRFLFLGESPRCLRAMETNLDGRVDLSDPITLLSHLFLGAAPLAPPYPSCGAAEETLECAAFPCPAV